MAKNANAVRQLARVSLGIAALGLAACSTEGVTPNCSTDDGGQLRLYDINEVDDSGVHPDPEVEQGRADLIEKKCLTAIGHATSPDTDSGSD
jgi:hypothetical protein